MATYAGQLVQAAATPGPEWHICNGAHIQPRAMWERATLGTLNPNDYARRTGAFMGRRGLGNWRVRLPNYKGVGNPWWVSLADDHAAAALPANTPTAQRPPPGVF